MFLNLYIRTLMFTLLLWKSFLSRKLSVYFYHSIAKQTFFCGGIFQEKHLWIKYLRKWNNTFPRTVPRDARIPKRSVLQSYTCSLDKYLMIDGWSVTGMSPGRGMGPLGPGRWQMTFNPTVQVIQWFTQRYSLLISET